MRGNPTRRAIRFEAAQVGRKPAARKTPAPAADLSLTCTGAAQAPQTIDLKGNARQFDR